MMTTRRPASGFLAAAALASALLVGGCVKLGSEPPETLLTVRASSVVAPGAVARGNAGTVTIVDPEVPNSLDTRRIAVRSNTNNIAYVKDAVWADTPDHLFRDLLAETVAARTGLVVLDAGQFSTDPGRRLLGQLIDFGINADTQQAVVTFDASLVGETGTVTKRRFSATAPVSRIDSRSVAPAIQAAANQVAVEMADWLQATR